MGVLGMPAAEVVVTRFREDGARSGSGAAVGGAAEEEEDSASLTPFPCRACCNLLWSLCDMKWKCSTGKGPVNNLMRHMASLVTDAARLLADK